MFILSQVSSLARVSDDIRLRQAMTDLYHRAQIRGALARLWALMRGASTRLVDLTAVEATCSVQARHYEGVQAASIKQIRGSQGCCHEFDANFNLLKIGRKQQWINLAVAWLKGITFPPVELIQVGDIYFVRDGHLRISVMRTLGQTEIEAEVTVWQVAESLPHPESRRINLKKRLILTTGERPLNHS